MLFRFSVSKCKHNHIIQCVIFTFLVTLHIFTSYLQAKTTQMKQITFLILIIFPFVLFGQDCDCKTNFEWLKKTFTENDAGFTYAIENIDKVLYKNHNKQFEEKVKSVTNSDECLELMESWLNFFRKGHLVIRKNTENEKSNSQQSEEEIKNQFKDWEKVEITLKDFNNYIKSKKELDYEGIWVSGPYEIGIKRIGKQYIGFVIEADGVYWTKKQVKLRINEDKSSIYYMQDHSPRKFPKAELIGENYLQLGFITLKRKGEFKESPKVKRYFKAINTQSPYFEIIDKKTTYIRIPSFNWNFKKEIDSVILNNKDLILKTPNLIIDLRNNGGGSDNSYSELLPIIYTNPIKTIGVEFLSTKLNNQRMLDILNGKFGELSEQEKQKIQANYKTLEDNLDEFVMFTQYPTSVTEFDTINKHPRNVGVIINENNGSTTEQFLLAAKQSKKVKLFGTTTEGVLDISNMHFVNSPCGDYELGYGLSRSMRIPEMTIDGKGIQPDYYINKYQFEKFDWIDFVIETLDNY